MDLGLKGRSALITDSTAGIGFQIACGLAAAGVKVAITGRTQQRVDDALARPDSSGPRPDQRRAFVLPFFFLGSGAGFGTSSATQNTPP